MIKSVKSTLFMAAKPTDLNKQSTVFSSDSVFPTMQPISQNMFYPSMKSFQETVKDSPFNKVSDSGLTKNLLDDHALPLTNKVNKQQAADLKQNLSDFDFKNAKSDFDDSQLGSVKFSKKSKKSASCSSLPGDKITLEKKGKDQSSGFETQEEVTVSASLTEQSEEEEKKQPVPKATTKPKLFKGAANKKLNKHKLVLSNGGSSLTSLNSSMSSSQSQ